MILGVKVALTSPRGQRKPGGGITQPSLHLLGEWYGMSIAKFPRDAQHVGQALIIVADIQSVSQSVSKG